MCDDVIPGDPMVRRSGAIDNDTEGKKKKRRKVFLVERWRRLKGYVPRNVTTAWQDARATCTRPCSPHHLGAGRKYRQEEE
ncbi:hypothetical protein CEXT_23901 [Caerostris extrusa]|uniref:Uncharacterized protein n=1 Tax=Caerostris extrusa TaxID=172846 RepID=A0AAV4NV90_CAEEX|nr:hypothetical protein CEXT_23901 [Caerostris extrusa]